VALVEPSFGPYQWAVPLWTERGLVGAILLGEKPGHGPYTEEESAAPSGDLVAALRHMVESEFAAEFDGVSWHTTEKPEPLLPLVQETVYYAVREAVRNAARHGRGADARRSLHLDIAIAVGERLVIVIADDGVGLANDRDPAEPGDGLLPAGAQGGLALHSTLIAIIGGRLTVDSAAGRGTRVTVELGFSSLTENQRR